MNRAAFHTRRERAPSSRHSRLLVPPRPSAQGSQAGRLRSAERVRRRPTWQDRHAARSLSPCAGRVRWRPRRAGRGEGKQVPRLQNLTVKISARLTRGFRKNMPGSTHQACSNPAFRPRPPWPLLHALHPLPGHLVPAPPNNGPSTLPALHSHFAVFCRPNRKTMPRAPPPH